MKNSVRRSFLRASLALGPLAAGLAAAPGLVRAQQPLLNPFPVKPVRIVVPFSAGGVADLTARTVAQKMAESLGQPVVIDNRPGAGGVVAGEVVARAEADGHTLLLMSNGSAVSASLFRSLPFDTRRDFAPVSLLGLFDLAVLVPEASPHKSIAALIAAGQSAGGRLNIGTINVGSTQHLAAEWLRLQANLVNTQIVPFNGSPALLQALRGGQVDAAVEIVAPVRAQISAKALRALALMGEAPAPDLPGVPVVRDLPGMSSINISSWNALAAPARTPRSVIDRLNREVSAALAAPDVRKRLADLSVRPRASTPDYLARLLDADIHRWSEVIQRAGIARQ